MTFQEDKPAKFIETNTDLVSVLGDRIITRYYLNDGFDKEVLNDIEGYENDPRLFCEGDTVMLVRRNGKLLVESCMFFDEVKPAIQRKNGDVEYWVNNQLHRDNGPALIENNGRRFRWYQNGKLHRENGPAMIASYTESYYLNGQYYEFQEWVKIIYQKLNP